MTRLLPKLRTDIDVVPSPDSEQPGLLIRDPYRYTPAVLLIPPALIQALAHLDGEKSYLDLQTDLSRQTGQLVGSDVVENFVGTLQQQGFLETEEFYRLRESCHAKFRDSAERVAIHSGASYPIQPEELRKELGDYLQAVEGKTDSSEVIGLAAPHVSPAGGWRSYASAYARMGSELAEKTFVLLGTSHYGPPEKFGLTRKPFITPLGTLEVDTNLVNEIAGRAGEAVLMEDYCHAIEHSIEFQCIFIQHAIQHALQQSPQHAPGSRIRILPILCGPFWESLVTGKAPESSESVERFFQVLGEIAEREGSRLFWVLGIDLAHIGRRYGDSFAARAEQDHMETVRRKDQERLHRVCAGDREGFFELVRPEGPEGDELRWCGYSPLYTFLQVVPQARGNVLRYEQWNIDEESVVSFAALEFLRDGAAAVAGRTGASFPKH